MNPIGAYICNFNGKDWVHKCIESLSKQTKKDFDIYVVDNASTDGTVENVKSRYGKEIGILVNSENLGGSGGFERGIQHGLGEGYKYIVLLDNDIELDSSFMKNVYEYMEEHEDVGIVGSKVMIMDEPDSIQDFGCRLDFVQYKEFQMHPLEKDDENIPEIQECDYVPTCAVMVRADALRKSGTMPADNFIYYDDIELSQKLKRNGYKVLALGNAKVWHKGGFRKGAVNTFPKYYFLRNRLHFFSKYVEDSDIDNFIDTLLGELFAQLFGYYVKDNRELFDAVNYAFYDYLTGVRGKAKADRIKPLVERDLPFQKCIKEPRNICIEMIDNYDADRPLDIFYVLVYLVGFIQVDYPKDHLTISLENCSYSKEEFTANLEKVIELGKPVYSFPRVCFSNDSDGSYDLILKMCKHVRDEKAYDRTRVFVDRYANCISSLEEFNTYQNYSFNEAFFKARYRNLMRERIKEIRMQLTDFDNKYYENEGFATMKKWLENRNAGKTFVEYFKDYGYKNIAIYGAGDLGRLLYEEIKDSDIKVSYFVDRNGEGILENEGIKVITVDKIKDMPLVDSIVITPVGNYEAISRALAIEAPELPTINLREAVYEF